MKFPFRQKSAEFFRRTGKIISLWILGDRTPSAYRAGETFCRYSLEHSRYSANTAAVLSTKSFSLRVENSWAFSSSEKTACHAEKPLSPGNFPGCTQVPGQILLRPVLAAPPWRFLRYTNQPPAPDAALHSEAGASRAELPVPVKPPPFREFSLPEGPSRIPPRHFSQKRPRPWKPSPRFPFASPPAGCSIFHSD